MDIQKTVEHIDRNAELVYTTGKLKYLYPLTKELKTICESLRKPYPKKEQCAVSITGLCA